MNLKNIKKLGDSSFFGCDFSGKSIDFSGLKQHDGGLFQSCNLTGTKIDLSNLVSIESSLLADNCIINSETLVDIRSLQNAGSYSFNATGTGATFIIHPKLLNNPNWLAFKATNNVTEVITDSTIDRLVEIRDLLNSLIAAPQVTNWVDPNFDVGSTGIQPALITGNNSWKNFELILGITAGTTPPTLQLKGSEDGVLWRNLSTPLVGIVGEEVVVTVLNTCPAFVSVEVTEAGSDITVGDAVVTLKAWT